MNSGFSLTSASNGTPGTNLDPGDRRSSFDFTYRLPKLRNWVTFYADGFHGRSIFPDRVLGSLGMECWPLLSAIADIA